MLVLLKLYHICMLHGLLIMEIWKCVLANQPRTRIFRIQNCIKVSYCFVRQITIEVYGVFPDTHLEYTWVATMDSEVIQ